MPLQDVNDAKNKASLCLEHGKVVPNNDGISEPSHRLKNITNLYFSDDL